MGDVMKVMVNYLDTFHNVHATQASRVAAMRKLRRALRQGKLVELNDIEIDLANRRGVMTRFLPLKRLGRHLGGWSGPERLAYVEDVKYVTVTTPEAAMPILQPLRISWEAKLTKRYGLTSQWSPEHKAYFYRPVIYAYGNLTITRTTRINKTMVLHVASRPRGGQTYIVEITIPERKRPFVYFASMAEYFTDNDAVAAAMNSLQIERIQGTL